VTRREEREANLPPFPPPHQPSREARRAHSERRKPRPFPRFPMETRNPPCRQSELLYVGSEEHPPGGTFRRGRTTASDRREAPFQGGGSWAAPRLGRVERRKGPKACLLTSHACPNTHRESGCTKSVGGRARESGSSLRGPNEEASVGLFPSLRTTRVGGTSETLGPSVALPWHGSEPLPSSRKRTRRLEVRSGQAKNSPSTCQGLHVLLHSPCGVLCTFRSRYLCAIGHQRGIARLSLEYTREYQATCSSCSTLGDPHCSPSRSQHPLCQRALREFGETSIGDSYPLQNR